MGPLTAMRASDMRPAPNGATAHPTPTGWLTPPGTLARPPTEQWLSPSAMSAGDMTASSIEVTPRAGQGIDPGGVPGDSQRRPRQPGLLVATRGRYGMSGNWGGHWR